MLVEFRVANFLSFKDEQVLSMVASSDDSHPENVAEAGGFRLLKSAAIYGPNAAGKSNLVKAMALMRRLVEGSAQRDPGSGIDVRPFMLDEEMRSRPSGFEVVFVRQGRRYHYGFEVTCDRVVGEWLVVYPKGSTGRGRRWFDRRYDAKKGTYEWSFSSYLRGEKTRIRDLTRDDALYVSVATRLNHSQLSEVSAWFRDGLVTSGPTTDRWRGGQRAGRVLGALEDDPAFRKWMTDLLRAADVGVSDIDVRRVREDPSLEAAGPFYTLSFRHASEATGLTMALPETEESSGTTRLFRLGGQFYKLIERGGILVIDEFEHSLHPGICARLLAQVQARRSEMPRSRRGVQLVFTTHNTVLLDSDLLRRDQVWFVEKDRDGASHLYPLSDYSPRKNEALGKGYLSGRYGAIPYVGDLIGTE